jgi:hypothetical protein
MNALKSLTLATLLGFAACAGGYVESGGYAGNPGYYTYAEPPEAQVEVQGVAPYPDAVWINGYWGWDTTRYNWRPGYWTHARPGYYWSPNRWTRDGNRWRFSRGFWRHRG